MPKLNITSALTQYEWDILQKKVEEKFSHKSKKTISHFLYSEINKHFPRSPQTDHKPCNTEKSKLVRKHFEISLDDHAYEGLMCLANHFGVEPATLIRRLFFEPEFSKLNITPGQSL